jgi:hypothetical protein
VTFTLLTAQDNMILPDCPYFRVSFKALSFSNVKWWAQHPNSDSWGPKRPTKTMQEQYLRGQGTELLVTGGWVSEPAVGPCLCELASGLVRKLQGTGAKVSDKTVPVWVGIWPCEKAPRNWGKHHRPDLACVIWYLTLWESQTSRKTVFKVPRWLHVLQR